MSSQPGWYDDPQDPRALRYWDGARWTDHRAPRPAPGGPAAPPQQQYGPPRPQYGPPQPQYGAPARARSSARSTIVIALSLATSLTLIGITGSQIFRTLNSQGGASAPTQPTGGATDSGGQGASTPPGAGPNTSPAAVQTYYLSERPTYREMRDYVEGTQAKYQDALHDGSIYQWVPETDEGKNYAQAFVYVLTDYSLALVWTNTASTNPDELDAQIQGYRDRTAEMERRFLAGEPLGISVQIVKSDGTVFESDGVAPQLVYEDPEEFARNFHPSPDANGSYQAAGEELAAAFGLQVTYDYQSIYQGCTPSDLPLHLIAASFCAATPDLIYVNPDSDGYPGSLAQPSHIDVMKHELSHRRIFDICGTTAPPIAGATYEGATNSYAVLFLGAERERLSQVDEYMMTPETDAAAQAIHEGNCG